jgi:hypothetical protein
MKARPRVRVVGSGNAALDLSAYMATPDRSIVTDVADPTPAELELGYTSTDLTLDRVHIDAMVLITGRVVALHAHDGTESTLVRSRDSFGPTLAGA